MTRAKSVLHKVHFRRRREGVTDYEKRLHLLRAGKPRFVVRKTNKYVIAQVIDYAPDGDKTVVGASSRELVELSFPGRCNTPSAYLTGALVAKKALAKNVREVVPDFGRHTASKGSLLYAALKGASDAGLQLSFASESLPSQERVEGRHLKESTAQKFVEVKAKIMGA